LNERSRGDEKKEIKETEREKKGKRERERERERGDFPVFVVFSKIKILYLKEHILNHINVKIYRLK
jgi:hypothetical protein